MNADKKTGRIVGALYIIATVAGMVGVGAFSGPVLDAPDYLTGAAANDTQVILGAFFELIMAVAVAGIAIAVYPVLKKHNVSIAIGYVAARVVEGVIFIIGVISVFTLLTLSREFVAAGAPDASYFQTSGELLLAVRDWGGHVVLDVAVFPLGALLFYSVLYRARLVPRWISGIGLIGAVLYWVASLFVAFDLIQPLSTVHVALQAPLGLQEMALAVWLIVKGFSQSASSANAQLSEAR
jgi:hypothetical protein